MAFPADSSLKYDDWGAIHGGISSFSGTIPFPLPFSFGVEIEVVANPKTIFNASSGNDFMNNDSGYWRRRLADRMNKKNGMHAVTSCAPRDYDRWYLTEDSSLKGGLYQVKLEAVSPIMHEPTSLGRQVDRFWDATKELFDVQPNFTCGAHVHVAPHERPYKLFELMKIAYAVATQENFLLQILPRERLDNDYCRPASFRSEELKLDLIDSQEGDPEYPFEYVAKALLKMKSIADLVRYMQSNSRYVLWNFQNTLKVSGTGTVEFRGGRHLRGPVRTKRWVSFVVSFIAKAIEDEHIFEMSGETDIGKWWQSIRFSAMDLYMDELLPDSWTSMRY